MCGGRLVHLPCSHLGHIARAQPYSFPGGRRSIEVYNYKRAVEVWVDPEYRPFIYDHFEEMKVNCRNKLMGLQKVYIHNFIIKER
jgi:polypeptide N-acetylgalactosaminyltransferase